MVSTGSNVGRITQIIGSTLDAEFDEGKQPKIYNALKTTVRMDLGGKATEHTLWCEVAQHLGGSAACVAGSIAGSRGDSPTDSSAFASPPIVISPESIT